MCVCVCAGRACVFSSFFKGKILNNKLGAFSTCVSCFFLQKRKKKSREEPIEKANLTQRIKYFYGTEILHDENSKISE